MSTLMAHCSLLTAKKKYEKDITSNIRFVVLDDSIGTEHHQSYQRRF